MMIFIRFYRSLPLYLPLKKMIKQKKFSLRASSQIPEYRKNRKLVIKDGKIGRRARKGNSIRPRGVKN